MYNEIKIGYPACTNIIFRKMMLVVLAVVGAFVCNGQGRMEKQKLYINPGVGFYRLTDDPYSINNTPLLLDLKIGMTVGKHAGLGFQFSAAYQSERVSGRSSIQQVGSGTVWTRSGTHTVKGASMGIFYERFFPMGKRLTFFPSVYGQFFYFKNIEQGGIFTGTETVPGITYSREILHNYKARIGMNINMQYAISKSTSVTLRFGQIDARFSYKFNPQVYFELPVLIGVKYSFQ